MRRLLERNFLRFLFIFILLNLVFYLFLIYFHSLLPLEPTFHFQRHLDHFLTHSQFITGKFDLLNNLAVYDAQWYLRLGVLGYPSLNDLNSVNKLSYAYFPLYPLLLAGVNIMIKEIKISAFLLSNLLLVANFSCLYFCWRKYFIKKTLIKALFLLFFFPGSVFFRSYFAENLLLLLLIIFAYYLMEKRYYKAGLVLSLLNLTKANVFLLNGLLLVDYYCSFPRHRINYRRIAGLILLITLPLIGFWVYCFVLTHDWLIILTIRSNWFYEAKSFPLFIIYNLKKILEFPYLPLHFYYASKVEVFIIVVSGVLLVKKRKLLPVKLWWIAFLLWLFPLLTTTPMSFMRYQTVSFPLFLMLANMLKGKVYLMILGLWIIGLLLVGLYFINWYWVG
jgi:hypothetical protein